MTWPLWFPSLLETWESNQPDVALGAKDGDGKGGKSCESPSVCCGLNSDTLEEWPVFLSTEPSLQPPRTYS